MIDIENINYYLSSRISKRRNHFKFFYSPAFNKVFLSFSVLFPFLMPLMEALEIEFFPRDAQSFFKNVVQQVVEGRKETGQVTVVYVLSKLLLFLKVTKKWDLTYFVVYMCISGYTQHKYL